MNSLIFETRVSADRLFHLPAELPVGGKFFATHLTGENRVNQH